MKLLNYVYEEGKPWSERLIPDWKKFKNVQYSLRINGAHGEEPGESYLVRVDHYHAQIILAYLVVMRRLGFDEDDINRFWDSSFFNVARNDITTRYSKK